MRLCLPSTAGSRYLIAIAIAIGAVALVSVDSMLLQDSRPSPSANAAKLQKGASVLPANFSCGTKNDLIYRVDVCVSPLMSILQGTIKKWPRENADARALCDDVS